MIFILLSLAFFVPGAVIGRWVVLLAPTAIWTVYAIGRDAGWWGKEPGEFLVLGTIILVVIGVVSAAAGVLVHRRAWHRGGRLRV